MVESFLHGGRLLLPRRSLWEARFQKAAGMAMLPYSTDGQPVRQMNFDSIKVQEMSEDMKKVHDNFSTCSWPGMYYGVVSHLASTVGAKRIAEIGVAYGYHANRILDDLNTIAYFGIDPYKAGYDAADPFVQDVARLFSESDHQKAMDRLHAAVRESLALRGERASLLRKPSVEGAATFEDEFFDTIFIDGDHTYLGAKSDLTAWWPKLRPGGVFCGDDYNWPDVKRAVDEFAAHVERPLQLVAKPNTSYPIWVIKK